MNEQQSAIIARIEAATDECDYDDIDLAIATWCYENGGILGIDYDPRMWMIRNGGEFARLWIGPRGWCRMGISTHSRRTRITLARRAMKTAGDGIGKAPQPPRSPCASPR